MSMRSFLEPGSLYLPPARVCFADLPQPQQTGAAKENKTTPQHTLPLSGNLKTEGKPDPKPAERRK